MSTTSPWRMGVVAGIFCLLQATPLMASENTVATVNGADTAWMIVATALVLFMTLPGLALFLWRTRPIQKCSFSARAVLCTSGRDDTSLGCLRV